MSVTIRAATADDQHAIRLIVRAAFLNPLGLRWHRFVVVDDDWQVIAVGQVKPHRDGSRELASLAVVPEYQGQTVGSTLVRKLLEREHGPVYLMCADRLVPFYARFGFTPISRSAMPPYFHRLDRLINGLLWLARRPERLAVLRREV